jgi:hypothetical protein
MPSTPKVMQRFERLLNLQQQQQQQVWGLQQQRLPVQGPA